MAKKKTFDNIVEESFNEGYNSEPEMPTTTKQEPVVKEPPAPKKKELTENEKLLRKILAGDDATLQRLWYREDRSTYYLTDLLRACIDIQSHNEGVTKNKVVLEALSNHFSPEVKKAAKERVISLAVKKLEQDIQEENK